MQDGLLHIMYKIRWIWQSILNETNKSIMIRNFLGENNLKPL